MLKFYLRDIISHSCVFTFITVPFRVSVTSIIVELFYMFIVGQITNICVQIQLISQHFLHTGMQNVLISDR